MAIDYVVNYEKNPPKGAEKLFYNIMILVFFIALISLIIAAPLLAIKEGTLKGDSFLPLDFILGLNTWILSGILAFSITCIVVCGVFADKYRNREAAASALSMGFFITSYVLAYLSFACSALPLFAKAVESLLVWLSSVGWLKSFSENAYSYILGYYIVIGVIFSFALLAWFTLARARERKELVGTPRTLASRLKSYFWDSPTMSVDAGIEGIMYAFCCKVRAMATILVVVFMLMLLLVATDYVFK